MPTVPNNIMGLIMISEILGWQHRLEDDLKRGYLAAFRHNLGKYHQAKLDYLAFKDCVFSD